MQEQQSVSTPLAPVSLGERIALMDALRGFAIFGIFMVNILLFAGPLREMMNHAGPGTQQPAEQVVHEVTRAFFEFKFVSLFSLLFGAGMMVQSIRAQQRGAAFTPVYLRRTFFLMLIGLCHALFIWYGDILFIYSVTALALMWFHRAHPRTLLIAGAIMLALSVLALAVFGALGVVFGPDTTQAATAHIASQPDSFATSLPDGAATQPAAGSFAAFSQALGNLQGGPGDPGWDQAETIAFRDGPFLAAVAMRAIMFLSFMIFGVFVGGFGFRVAGMFLLGMALMKMGFFRRERRVWHKRAALLGLGLGIPGELLLVAVYRFLAPDAAWLQLGGEILHQIASLALCLGYVGAWALIVDSGLFRLLTTALAAVGRMALTNYLMQSVVATGLMYWWGLGWFGEVSRTQQALIVVCVFVGQIFLSLAWLSVFAMGPMEWLWRTLTYGRIQPLLRRNGTASESS